MLQKIKSVIEVAIITLLGFLILNSLKVVLFDLLNRYNTLLLLFGLMSIQTQL